MKPLKIYKASAGSGKTFRLAVEYIKLLMKDPTCYRNILAVTFTNKATTEMKLRILSQLYGIGNGLKTSEGYFDAIKADAGIARLHLSDDQLRLRALTALEGMMHDYGRFRIETIDSFFQSLIRELAHELHLTSRLHVDLDSAEVVRTAVKELLNSLTTDKDLLRTVLSVVEEKINDNRNWHIEEEVTRFGKNIFNEHFLENKNTGSITTQKDVETFRQHLFQLRTDTLRQIRQLGGQFMRTCEEKGYDSTYFAHGTRGVWNFLAQTAKGNQPLPDVTTRVTDCVDDAGKWPSKNHPEVQELAEREFMPLLRKVLDLRHLLNSIEASRKHLGQLLLLDVIDGKVRQLNADENRFLLADTAYMLWQMVKGQDVPFIYERSGVRFTHIMIDEFQDTSTLQWKNFIPLLLNSMATQSLCLIVGDVKQSIYRWRNGDWGILKDLEKNPPLSPYVETPPMRTNYRSAEGVVRFNNEFFSRAAQVLQTTYANTTHRTSTDITDAYKDVVQEVVPKNEGHGYVHVELLKKSESASQLERMVDTVQTLRDQGVRVQDMCILVRQKSHIPDISAAFAQRMPDVSIVSDEAFRLDASPALNFIILAMRVVANPQNRFLLATLTYEYRSHVLNEEIFDDINRTFLLAEDDLRALLPEAFRAEEATLPTLPLYELAEHIYDLFSLQRLKGQDAYLFSFFDKVMEFLADRPSDLDTFLTYWDDTLRGVTIPVGEVKGIRILSIHKAKGLEFHTVIIPHCDWTFTMGHTTTVWVKPKEAPFNELDLLPIDIDKTSADSCFTDDSAEEKLKNYVDNLNLLYVAFTRAVKNLIVFADLKTGKSVENVSQVLQASMPPTDESDETDTTKTYSSGSIVASPLQEKKEEVAAEDTEQNVLTIDPQPQPTDFVTQKVTVEFRQSNRATQFAQGDDEGDDDHRRYLNEGVLFHQLLSMIQTPDDLPAAIRRMDFEGYFDNATYRQEVMQLVERAFKQTEARRWFDRHWRIHNECTIVCRAADGGVMTRRPDRVVTDDTETIVIDYKTGRQDEEHVKQVQLYMQQLQAMNYPNVSGYVWYIRRGDIVRVT